MTSRRIQLSDIKVLSRRAIVAYCDITGFMTYLRKAAHDQDASKIFIARKKFEFLKFRKKTGYFTIDTGDGLIAIIETGKVNCSKTTFDALRDVSDFIRSMRSVIRSTPYPRPEGFRARVTAGPLYRTEMPRPFHEGEIMIDYVGDSMNLGSRILKVERQIELILHDSVIELLDRSEKRLVGIRRLSIDAGLRGTDIDDMKALSEYWIK